MRIISWNCNMAFRKKYPEVMKLKPDLLVIQECEHPKKNKKLNQESQIWAGKNQNKGIGIFGLNKLEVELHQKYSPKFKYIIPFKIKKWKELIIVAVWAMNNTINRKRRYIGEVFYALQYYQEILTPKTIILGDFNWNAIWDAKPQYPLKGTLTEVVKMLKEQQIQSVYHTREQEEFGKETQPTLFQYRHKEKPYHIDYMFVSHTILQNIREFQIGEYSKWIEWSDHMPLICEIEKIAEERVNTKQKLKKYAKKSKKLKKVKEKKCSAST